ncbi:ABC protein [Mycena filopes]|nr:ABC protein [Mycena filopes]
MPTKEKTQSSSDSLDDESIKDLEKGQPRKTIDALQLDVGKEHIRFREKWWQLWIPAGLPPPPPDSLDDAKIIPIVSASLLSQLTYTWITPMMVLGYQRTLQATDLWKVGPKQEAGYLSEQLDAAWMRRVEAAAAWNAGLDDGRIKPPVSTRFWWSIKALAGGTQYRTRRAASEKQWREIDGRKQASLAWAMNDVLGHLFWYGGAYKVFGDTAQLMGPILVKAIINFAKARAAAREAGTELPPVGRGIAMAVGLICVVIMASIFQHQFFWRSMTTGVLARAALTSSIYKRGVRLTGKARTTLTNSDILNHVSTDVRPFRPLTTVFFLTTFASGQPHRCVCAVLGPSALAGFSLFVFVIPLSERIMARQLKTRAKSMKFTDRRAEDFTRGSMRVVKYFCYEVPFLKRIFEIRENELRGIQQIQHCAVCEHRTGVLVASTSIDARVCDLHACDGGLVLTDVAFKIDPDQKFALDVRNVSFEWESASKDRDAKPDKASAKLKEADLESQDDQPFRVQNGTLAGVVGRVGSGKSSLMQGLIGEMRCIGGRVFNASLRDNVLFGRPFDSDRYWGIMETACLLPDLQLLPDGDLTEKETGVNLSGGQKQRVNIARALYYDADVIIFDDPLSAVQQGKSVVLVTHALHFLSQCDYIYTVEGGRISEHGSYQALLDRKGESLAAEQAAEGESAENLITTTATRPGTGKIEGKLITKEKTDDGLLYGAYIKAGRGYITIPLILLAVLGMQGCQISNSYTLIWWQANTFNRSFSFYQTLYAALGISQSTFTFLMGVGIDFLSMNAAKNLHHDSVHNILYAPMSFFVVLVMSNMSSAIILISVLEHYFIIAAVAIALGYSYFAAFYRASAREMKRLDAMLRSVLYAHLSESLTGLPTIRSYGEIPRFIEANKYYIDLENRALFLTVTNQRWLAIRLDACGAMMVFTVAIFAVIGVSGISPAQIGLVLTYTTQLTQMCSMVTRQSAELESYMNSVERVVHYSRTDVIPQEAAYESDKDHKPPANWPKSCYRPGLPNVLHGISMSINAGEKIGVVVSRTGAGKSSLALTLLRIVEYSGTILVDDVDIAKIGLKDLRANISIIPQDPTLFSGTVRTVLDPFGRFEDARLWDALRRSFLVDSGTSTPISSLDHGEIPRHRIDLDTVVDIDGANLSVGERSLLSLARALVKDSKVVILDEATASVDLETDNKIQRTIQTQFKDNTLLCIAHRLRTIISYDRILGCDLLTLSTVLEAGKIAEFDAPLTLFNRPDSIFRGLCEKSSISYADFNQ